MNVCMADGSVRALAGGMDRLAWWALVTPAGGEAIGGADKRVSHYDNPYSRLSREWGN